MGILDEDKIEKWIIPHLSTSKGGRNTKVGITKIVLLILQRLKTGCQWRELSIGEYVESGFICWQTVYYHFNKWSEDGSFKQVWLALLAAHKSKLDMSCVQIDGSHTPAKNGGIAVSYQGRKACKTSNSLFLCDNQGQMLSVSTTQSGEHNDLYEIAKVFKELLHTIKCADINTEGLFMNAAAGFDSQTFRQLYKEENIEANIRANPRNKTTNDNRYVYFDEELYKRRTKIEQANAWMDAFKALRIRYETKICTWMSQQWLAFIVRFCKKLKTNPLTNDF